MGFANLWVSIFFILSGYGIFHSLEYRFYDNKNISKKLIIFYYDRLIRIFPLLWISWIVQWLVTQGDISCWTLLGVHGQHHYWFIPALLQCYILSPLIYYGIKKHVNITILSLISVIVIISYLSIANHMPPELIKLLDFINSKWRKVYFLYVLLFSFGLWLPTYLNAKTKTNKIYNNRIKVAFFYLFMTAILLFMVILKYKYSSSSLYGMFLSNIALLFISLLCVYAIINQVQISFFNFIGSISYSVYLFHMSFILVVDKIEGSSKDSFKELLLIIILFPLFIYLCKHLERLGGYISTSLKKYVIV